MRLRFEPFVALALAVGAAPGCSGGSNLNGDCSTLCDKIASAGCASSDCVSSCEQTASNIPSSCVSAYDTLVNCGATSGTVTCTAAGYSIGSCESQAAAVVSCVNGACPTGTWKETCTNIQCTDTEVTASCRSNSGSYVDTSLPLPCNDVSNCNGQLTCSPTC